MQLDFSFQFEMKMAFELLYSGKYSNAISDNNNSALFSELGGLCLFMYV